MTEHATKILVQTGSTSPDFQTALSPPSQNHSRDHSIGKHRQHVSPALDQGSTLVTGNEQVHLGLAELCGARLPTPR